MSQPVYGISIRATDDTAKGVKSAEKNIGRIPKAVGQVNANAMRDAERRVGASGRGMVRTFGQVERAASQAFGGRGATSGFISRIGGMTSAARAMGTAFGGAAVEGEGLAISAGLVASAVAATVGVLAAGAIAAFQLGKSWGDGAAKIGRTADIIGVSTQKLQEFGAAAERYGVDKDKAIGGLGGLSETLNDARYGRNTAALAALTRLGIKLQTNGDGTVDVGAMLPSIADAITRQNSSGRRTAARLLGIPLDVLPAFMEGGKSLSSEMADTDSTAPMLSTEDIALGKKLQRRNTKIAQRTQRETYSRFGRYAAEGTDAVENFGVRVWRGITGDIGGSARKMDDAAGKIDRAADRMAGGYTTGSKALRASNVRGGVLAITPQDIVDFKKGLSTEVGKNAGPELMAGTLQVMINRLASGKYGGTARSVLDSKSQFSDVNGPVAWSRGRHSVNDIPMSRVPKSVNDFVDWYFGSYLANGGASPVGDAMNYANPNHKHLSRKNWGWVDALPGPTLGSGDSRHKFGTAPNLQGWRPGEFKVQLTEPVPVKVTVDLRGAPKGATATAEANGSVSYAYGDPRR